MVKHSEFIAGREAVMKEGKDGGKIRKTEKLSVFTVVMEQWWCGGVSVVSLELPELGNCIICFEEKYCLKM